MAVVPVICRHWRNVSDRRSNCRIWVDCILSPKPLVRIPFLKSYLFSVLLLTTGSWVPLFGITFSSRMPMIPSSMKRLLTVRNSLSLIDPCLNSCVACALRPDLALLAEKDMTQVGEKGLNLFKLFLWVGGWLILWLYRNYGESNTFMLVVKY